MALDGVFLSSLLTDLKDTLINSKIDKINQPEMDEIILTLRKDRKNFKLLISSSSQFARLHITNIQKENPLKAPLYLMVLRKYIVGGTIIDVTQKDTDRVVTLTISSRDELGYDSKYLLIVEIMGRHSNISLIRERDMKVMESIKHITPDINTYRVLYPGVEYIYPPASTKLNPFDFKKEELITFVETNDISLDEYFFLKTFTGVSKSLSKELFLESSENNYTLTEIDILYKFITDVFKLLKNYPEFNIILDNYGLYKDFHSLIFKNIDKNLKSVKYDNPSKMLEDFYSTKDKQERLHSRTTNLQRLVTTNIDRCLKKEKILNKSIADCMSKEKYKIFGDLLTSYIYSLKKGLKEITLQNYYSENYEDITIALNPNKTPSENVQNYYKKYNKLKKAEVEAKIQLDKNLEELNYLNSVLTNILNIDSYSEIDPIKRELMETGYIKFKKESKKESKSKPLHFVSSEGIDIYVGKNNIQNDYLSLKFAKKNWLWMHTKDVPGSHVIVCTDELLDKTIEEASVIAAFYSKAKTSSKVEVDYTKVKELKKPVGAKPGMVIYHTNWTLVTDPSEFNNLNLEK
ncbi:NFACT RNA binding domain-containing protein [Clostridium sp. LY3-2]|uniref:Rqc2 family fibronectin-binding protein n=1 Tax=Clostridium sp. LY3-2 TaxID=2942482 RepID=UPI002152B12D|nr:NFACT RNA binding domain-containing protein [Clostridium sp. LY3-2]MCR6515394.1 NFACT RNA binding domain-containing protein [Clostridium sp. LY3-2]